jgi:Tfp pilus assembly protein FimT
VTVFPLAGIDERGTSLIEMTVALAVVCVVGVLATPVLSSALVTSSKVESQSRSLDELRVAMNEIARQTRSAECVYQPSLAAPDGNTLSIKTDANNAVHNVTYTLSSGQLTRQIDGGTGYVVARGLTTATAFHYSSTPRTSLVLTFSARYDVKQAPRLLTTTIAGRNAWHTPPTC